jgi:hypothetical protein
MKLNRFKYILLVIACLQFSCKKYLEIDPPKGRLVQETVFENDNQATSALIGIYAAMANSNSYASGSSSSISCLSGLSSDDLTGFNTGIIPFYQNQITPDLSLLQNLYDSSYQSIYSTNAVLEGLSAPNSITPPVLTQLQGEALFLRAFTYFYLVNLYGSVPLQLTTDYRVTQVASKATVAQIYQQILLDLTTAENLLPEAYPTTGRVRPNKSAVQALLGRVYLYLKDYVNAEKYASLVIGKSTYSLVDVNSVFLANSQEAIWQLMPSANTNTQEGALFILTGTPTFVALNSDLALNGFEANDKRKSWIGSVAVGSQIYYFPYKYKVRSSSTVTEYSMVLRLAEQYLIRAEARINQPGKVDQGIADLNVIRSRARPTPTANVPNPLPLLATTLSQSTALLAVEQERRVELFSEWGHRWFDLIRTGRATTVLSAIKPPWQTTDVLYPIPSDEISRNSNITQNPGY